MNAKIKLAVSCIITAAVGVTLGSLDQIEVDQHRNAQVKALCTVQPSQDKCKQREAAAQSVRYSFNGQAFVEAKSVAAYGANE